MTDDKTRTEPPPAAGDDGDKPASETKPAERPAFGKIKTDDEARLAAEIEKLRG